MRSQFSAAVVFFSLPAMLVASENVPVYADGLAAGWTNWSWSSTIDFAVASPHHGAGGTSIGVTYTQGWAGIYLHSDINRPASDYASLKFSIHGGSAGGQKLSVVAYNANLGAGTAVTVSPPAAGAWTDVTVPISSLGVNEISGIVWQSSVAGSQPRFYLDDIELTGAPDVQLSLSVNAGAARHAISPHIYGLNFASASIAAELHLPVNRWGGNATTRYNWKTDVSNHASDWFFENLLESNSNPAQLPDGSTTDRFAAANQATQTDSIITLPLIGWTPKPPRTEACGFSVAKYGAQQKTDPYRSDCGNGLYPNGTPITTNDPHDTSIAIDPAWVGEWVGHLAGRFGSAAQGGVRFYNLDNEPMLWNSTHRDVHPQGTSYDEIRDRTWQYGQAIKTADPTALTLGPVLWGWSAYFYSAADQAGGGEWWNTRPDRRAHGDTPFVEWYLQQMKVYEQAHGQRILDYLDLHYYPQAENVSLKSAGDGTVQAKRLRSTRSLWDPTYTDESWIGEAVRLIPRMKAWVNTYYPGTKLAITEYNWGGHEHINGALAQADVLGIFGREGLDLATLWDPPSSSEPAMFAFRMYRNYDGAGGQFGETSIQAVSADQAKVAIHAALRQDGKLTLILINKTGAQSSCTIALAGFVPAGQAAVYRYSSADLAHIVPAADLPLSSSSPTVTLPANSITLLVIPPRPLAAADFDRDGDVDAGDLQHFGGCRAGPQQPVPANCTDADLDHDSDVDQSDFGILQRCLSGADTPASPACEE